MYPDQVEDLATWYSGMVAVPKKSGQVRICIDFRPLNENVLREIHLLPTGKAHSVRD